MSVAEEIFEEAKTLPPGLQQEALDFVRFLIERQQPINPESEEFASELMAAFTEAKARERVFMNPLSKATDAGCG
jgi:hypothetical protein